MNTVANSEPRMLAMDVSEGSWGSLSETDKKVSENGNKLPSVSEKLSHYFWKT